MRDGSFKIRRLSSPGWIVAIIAVSTVAAMIISWRAPGLDLYARDRLMQARGPKPPPDDIAIVAIDEASIARYGRFPWARALTARVLDSISSSQPKAIALDVLYSEPTTANDDAALADSIKRAGNTVVAAQLIETTDDSGSQAVRWLRPLPSIESAAAAVGHVNVSTEAEGGAREFLLRNADDHGQTLWSIGVETIRVGEGIRPATLREISSSVQLGTHNIPLAQNAPTIRFTPRGAISRVDTVPAERMMIDYIGPPGSFAHQTFSFADVLDGHIPAQSFRGKYVLVGATAATLGDHVSSPFVHTGGAHEQFGELMPGVEVLANSMNTILRSQFYREIPDWVITLLAALVAAAVLGALSITQGRFESAKQIGALLGLLGLIIAVSYVSFARWLIDPPIVPALLSFVIAAPLALLRRSLSTSADLDARIAELTDANELLLLSTPGWRAGNNLNSNPATLIAHLAEADTVAIYAYAGRTRRYRLVSSHGGTPVQWLAESEVLGFASSMRLRSDYSGTGRNITGIEDNTGNNLPYPYPEAAFTHPQLAIRLGGDAVPDGALIIKHVLGREVKTEILRLCEEIATSSIAETENSVGSEPGALAWWRFPRGVEWKAHALGVLNRRMLARARFVDRALRAVEDGLIVADVSGRIAFANPRAAEILGVPERTLRGSDLFLRLRKAEHQTTSQSQKVDQMAREMLMRVILDRATVECEITVAGTPPRYYMLRLSTVTSGDDGAGQVLGLVAALSDVTQQHELQEMKTDVMTLVTHELLTPLTAIQGMSEVLAQFTVADERRREMHQAINDEAKRLSHMIKEYLDITKLESGAHPLRLGPVRLVQLVERVLLLLDPLAAQRGIRIVRRLSPNAGALLADSDLLAQALTNLIGNAIKYSPSKTDIIVAARDHDDALIVEITDHGYGIPAAAISHIFEKFYRVPRVEDADVPGTGLGLALVREIVELHGGRVTVQSEFGKGSTFTVRLPVSPKVN